MEPMISVIIEERGDRELLSRCVNSIYRQKYSRIDIICIDSNSDDYSYECFDSVNVVDSLGNAVKFSTSEYLFFVDRETVLGTNVINILVEWCKMNCKGDFICSSKLFDLKAQKEAKHEQYISRLTGKMILRKDFLNLFSTQIFDEVDYINFINRLANRISIVSDAFCYVDMECITWEQLFNNSSVQNKYRLMSNEYIDESHKQTLISLFELSEKKKDYEGALVRLKEENKLLLETRVTQEKIVGLSGPELANCVERLYRNGRLGTRTIIRSFISLLIFKIKGDKKNEQF